MLSKPGPWVHLDLPAIAEEPQAIALGPGRVHHRAVGEVLHPEHDPLAVLEAIKADIGSYAFSAHYQQQPIPLEGNLVRWSWFRTYDAAPGRQDGDTVTQSWDTASKDTELSDYSVCTTWHRHGEEHYLIDVHRQRLDYPDLKRRVVEMKARFHADTVLIEDAGSGTALTQDLRREGRVYPIAIKPEADKVTRMAAQSARIEAGKVLVPVTAPWLDAFRTELLLFPHARHDDQVDSISQYLGWSTRRPTTEAEFVVFYSAAQAAIARGLDPEWVVPWDDRPWSFSSKRGWRPASPEE